ncbi:MAG: 4Fe-4S binding protein [Chloroflexi bacterium]|nr:4Fe-4S binding protein [Chloroflexota bacterium]
MTVVKSKPALKEKYIKIHAEKCIGCNACVYGCALKHTGDLDPAGSRISIVPDPGGKGFTPINCAQCAEPKCIEVCPAGALTRRGAMTSVQDERCIGCLACTMACPYAGARFDKQAGMSMLCDLCDGDPECVRMCPTGALEYEGVHSIRADIESAEDVWSKGVSCCLGCPTEIVLRFALKVLGKNTILHVSPSCAAAAVSGFGEQPNVSIPNMMGFLTNSSSIMTGVRRHYRRMGRDVNILAFAGDGGTADVGFQSLSGAAERNEQMIYICNDNEGYMNTGVQRSGTTPYGAWTSTTPVGDVHKGKRENSKEMAWIMLAHGVPYVATASVGFLSDLEAKLQKALTVKGFSYIHLHTPCPTGWRFGPENTVQVARMAVKTNYFPLWEAVSGRLRQTVRIRKPLPIVEYTKLMGKYGHLSPEQQAELQKQVDERYNRVLLAASAKRFF